MEQETEKGSNRERSRQKKEGVKEERKKGRKELPIYQPTEETKDMK